MMRNASTFLRTPLYRKVYRKIRDWVKASLLFIVPHSLDTITTRFLILFLFLLSVPLGSVIIFTRDIVTQQQERLAAELLTEQYQLFNEEIQRLKEALTVLAHLPSNAMPALCDSGTVSLCMEGVGDKLYPVTDPQPDISGKSHNGPSSVLSASALAQFSQLRPLQPTFMAYQHTLYLWVKTPVSRDLNHFWVLGKALDQSFLNHFYRIYSQTSTNLLIMATPVTSDSAAYQLEVISNLPQEQAQILRQRLGRIKPSTLAEKFAEKSVRLTLDAPGVGDQLTMIQPIYDGQDRAIAQVAYLLPLAPSQLVLQNYYQVIYWIVIASLIFTVGLAMLAGRTITQPLLQLIEQVNELSRMKILSGIQPVQMKGVFEITQLSIAFNRMMERLGKEQALKDNFVATLTHDLKVPLLAKKQTLAYFLKEVYGPVNETQLEILQTLQSTNQDCLGLVSSLLEIYRYSSGGVTLLWETFNLLDLLNQTLEELKSLAQEKSITIEKDFELLEEGKNYAVYADPVEIRRVLHNLLSNAITNTPSYGVIQCRVGTANYFGGNTIYKVSGFGHTTLKYPIKLSGKMLIVIQDSGLGFSKEELPELFQQFTSNKGRNPMSIGLGLHNCYQVIQAHNNMLWVESTEGVGSAVSFTLSTNEIVAQDRRIFRDRRKKR